MAVVDIGVSFQGLEKESGRSLQKSCSVSLGSRPPPPRPVPPLPSQFSFPMKPPSFLAVARVGLGVPTVGPSVMLGEVTGP